jgi:hypothetical protein
MTSVVFGPSSLVLVLVLVLEETGLSRLIGRFSCDELRFSRTELK